MPYQTASNVTPAMVKGAGWRNPRKFSSEPAGHLPAEHQPIRDAHAVNDPRTGNRMRTAGASHHVAVLLWGELSPAAFGEKSKCMFVLVHQYAIILRQRGNETSIRGKGSRTMHR